MYERLYKEHGKDARALLHADRESQHERFLMLTRCFDHETEPFSVHEIGCSFGHLGDYVGEGWPHARYSGSDICPPFIEECRRRFPDGEFFLRDVSTEVPEDRYDYVVLCGTFNIPQDSNRDEWQRFVYSMIEAMYAMCRKAIGVTFLTTYVDPGRERSDLYYQDEKHLLDFVARRLSRHFVLDSAGPLYEYTIRVYRPEYVWASREEYRRAGFERYFKFDRSGK